jgi:hypothetical protein
MDRGHLPGRWRFSQKNDKSLEVKGEPGNSERRLCDELWGEDEKWRTCESQIVSAKRRREVFHFAGDMDGFDMRQARALGLRSRLLLAL